MTARVELARVATPTLRVVNADAFLDSERTPLEPFVATPDGRTVLLARDGLLLVAGPSGTGKSLAASFDLGGRLASDEDSTWLDLAVKARRTVLLLSFEGSDEDTAERVEQLVPADARQRFHVVDRWRGADLPQANEPGRRMLADALRGLSIDVLLLDTAAAYFGGAGGFDVSKGIPEQAFAVIEDLRARSGRRFACIVVAHTRKADRGGGKVDELEEISGTFPRKVDAAIVLRRDGDESSSRRRVIFAKVRRGPQPRTLIARLPDDPDEPPRLEVVAEAGRPLQSGTEAQTIAAWIASHDAPIAASVVRARFDLADTTLRRRKDALEALGVECHRLPGGGNAHGYGTAQQWRSMVLTSDGVTP